MKPSIKRLIGLWAIGLEFCDLKRGGWLPGRFFAGHSLLIKTMLSFLPIGAELANFVFSRARRADNASEVADCDLHIASWEGADFGYGRRQASIGVHSDEKR